MPNQVFMFSYPQDALPGDNEAIMDWAEAETNRLTGGAVGRVVHFIQQSNHAPEYRLTISVPDSATDALAALRANGAEPQFEEPEKPYAEGNEIILPGSFQITNFGGWLHPRSVEENPERIVLLCSAINQALPDLPVEARDWTNWSAMDHDEDDGTFTIAWGEPEEDVELEWRPTETANRH